MWLFNVREVEREDEEDDFLGILELCEKVYMSV